MLVLIAGLPGTGKTTVARAFAEESGAIHLNSDALRRQLGLMGHYTPEAKQKVYDALLDNARDALLKGQTVVVDSTFYNDKVRSVFRQLAHDCQVPLRWVELRAKETTLQQRLQQTRPDSEADYQVYLDIRRQFEPLPDERLVIDTDEETAQTAAQKISQYLLK
jgi:predicted kinase